MSAVPSIISFVFLLLMIISVRVINEKEQERRNPGAFTRRQRRRGAWGLGRKFFDFLSDNDAFWCIMGACFNVSIRRVKQSRKAVLYANCQLVSYLTWRTYHGKLQLIIGVCRKKQQERRSSAFPSDSNPGYTMRQIL